VACATDTIAATISMTANALFIVRPPFFVT